jgi:uncharacterized protein (TIGR02284 family)
MPNDPAISTLNDLIHVSKDGEKGFRAAWEQTDRSLLKESFKAMSQDCAKAAAQLEALVRKLGAEPEIRGTATGAMHRGWIAAKAAVTKADDKAILDECLRGEEHAVKEYDRALTKPLPPVVRETVESQARGAKKNLELVRQLRERPTA